MCRVCTWWTTRFCGKFIHAVQMLLHDRLQHSHFSVLLHVQPDDGDAYDRETTVLDDTEPDDLSRASFARGFGGGVGGFGGRVSGYGNAGLAPLNSFERRGSVTYQSNAAIATAASVGASASPSPRRSVSLVFHRVCLVACVCVCRPGCVFLCWCAHTCRRCR